MEHFGGVGAAAILAMCALCAMCAMCAQIGVCTHYLLLLCARHLLVRVQFARRSGWPACSVLCALCGTLCCGQHLLVLCGQLIFGAQSVHSGVGSYPDRI